MANPLRNAMIYLGLSEEEDEQYQEQPRQTATATATAPAPAAREQRPQLVEERQVQAPVTPITKHGPKPAPTMASDMNEILTVHPKAYKDAQFIAERFRDGVPVIMNLSQMEDGEARRLIDFASGLSTGLYGKIERVTSRVFLLSPQHVAVKSEQERESAGSGSFFA